MKLVMPKDIAFTSLTKKLRIRLAKMFIVVNCMFIHQKRREELFLPRFTNHASIFYSKDGVLALLNLKIDASVNYICM